MCHNVPIVNFSYHHQEEEEDGEKAVIGFWSAFCWLVGMTMIIALLSEYVVGTIEVIIHHKGETYLGHFIH